jgi:deoxyribodipyrimidine photo-lyase
MKINIFWFRRDLRLNDNTGLNYALSSGLPVLPVFIFDTNITDELPADDPRISFIYETLYSINKELQKSGSSVLIIKGDPEKTWKNLIVSYDINAVYINKDYEPYSIQRDKSFEILLGENKIPLLRFKDQVIYEEEEILKSDKKPYTVFTPYRNKWLQEFTRNLPPVDTNKTISYRNFFQCSYVFPELDEIGFRKSTIRVRQYDLSVISSYDKYRDFPALDKTSYLSPHLRFGTVSIRSLVNFALHENQIFLGELIWREFFMQILFHFPNVVTANFRSKYDDIQWRNREEEFEKWCKGETGYPLVDAGMRQLNRTGYMHNRVRMITAGFLCKQLLIDWRWGEAYFAEKLLDYEMSSNNGNWQWAAGTGCDAAPYFRVFNPDTQLKKFDSNKDYIKKWIEDFDGPGYQKPIVDNDFARKRAIETYRTGIKKNLYRTT